jgi:hypothetical protein
MQHFLECNNATPGRNAIAAAAACGMRPNTVVVPRHPAAPLLPRCLQVWAELADGSCRWRQTGGEVKVLALRVPKDLPTKQLAVAIEPYSLKGGPGRQAIWCSAAAGRCGAPPASL